MHMEDWDREEDGRGLLLQFGGILVVFGAMFVVAYVIVLLAS